MRKNTVLTTTVIRVGAEHRIILEILCEKCYNPIAVTWQGKIVGKDVVFPCFGETAFCQHCNDNISIRIDRISALRWLYLAKLEIINCLFSDSLSNAKKRGGSKTGKKRKKKIKYFQKKHLESDGSAD